MRITFSSELDRNNFKREMRHHKETAWETIERQVELSRVEKEYRSVEDFKKLRELINSVESSSSQLSDDASRLEEFLREEDDE